MFDSNANDETPVTSHNWVQNSIRNQIDPEDDVVMRSVRFNTDKNDKLAPATPPERKYRWARINGVRQIQQEDDGSYEEIFAVTNRYDKLQDNAATQNRLMENEDSVVELTEIRSRWPRVRNCSPNHWKRNGKKNKGENGRKVNVEVDEIIRPRLDKKKYVLDTPSSKHLMEGERIPKQKPIGGDKSQEKSLWAKMVSCS